jgi:hypothetical protein
LKVKDIRKKSGIPEGGDIYIFCTTNKDNNTMVLITEKRSSLTEQTENKK